MNITPMEMDIIGRNDEFFDEASGESLRGYISRKRRSDMVNVVKDVLKNELSDIERKVLLEMVSENKPARIVAEELDTSLTQIYRIRDRAEKKMSDYLKYVVCYQEKYENISLTPIEYRKILATAKTLISPCKSIVHRLRKLMAKDCIDFCILYKNLGMSRKSDDDIFEGARLPDADEIIKLSYFFKTSADYLLKGEMI